MNDVKKKIIFPQTLECVYRDKSGGEYCKPPDNSVLEDIHCDNCKYYLNYITPEAANKAIILILDGYTNKQLEKRYHKFLYKHKIKTKSIKAIEQYNLEYFIQLQTFSNEDYMSQCISKSSYWQQIIASHFPISHTDYGISNIAQDVFKKPANELTLLQLILLNTTIKYLQYKTQYKVKSLCKQCLEGGKKLEIFLKPRQKYCQRDKTHMVNLPDSRVLRWYYTRDRDNNMYISDMQDVNIISLLEWHTDNFSDTLKIKEEVKKHSKGK